MLRRCSIDTDPEDLPYKTVESPVIKIGDLVRFSAKIDEDIQRLYYFRSFINAGDHK